ncbi:MAG TPA: hypothetical protein VFO29_02780 [Candidatus Rubrimentiphilum sp.]|nr:hypothetical protein [Candidatus Rubrimentiphilum sp.]
MKKLCVLLIAALMCSCGSAVTPAAAPNPDFVDCGSSICIINAPSAPAPSAFFVKGVDYAPVAIGKTPTAGGSVGSNNSAVWSRDLPLMRAMGVNAVRVYDAPVPNFDSGPGTMDAFLDAAWNGGINPIYVIATIFFTRGNVLSNQDATNAIANQYHDFTKKYGGKQAFMGVTISNELGLDTFDATEWGRFNQIARAAKQGLIDAGAPSALVMTAEADGVAGGKEKFIAAAETNNAAVDAYGVNVFRGRTLTTLLSDIHSATNKPVLITEWGAPASTHLPAGPSYTFGTGPTDIGSCTYSNPGALTDANVSELAATGNPSMTGLNDLITNVATAMYNGFKSGGVVSGGFYLEWQDEWWKLNNPNPTVHTGMSVTNGAFPGCFNDESWYGLNAVSLGTPQGAPDVLTARSSLQTLKNAWANEP